MAPHRTRILAVTLGLLSAAGLVLVWIVLLAPVGWRLEYPGGALSGLLSMISYLVMSFAAGWLGSRKWFVLTIIVVLTFVYMTLVLRSPYWN
jgi:hypothetical protein